MKTLKVSKTEIELIERIMKNDFEFSDSNIEDVNRLVNKELVYEDDGHYMLTSFGENVHLLYTERVERDIN